jgi:hypothetical protein
LAEDKTLKFKAIIDEAGKQKFLSTIREMATEVSKLTNQVNNIGLGGGQGVASMGLKGAKPGQIGKQTKQTGGTSGLTNIFTSQKNLFKSLANESKDSLRVMSDALKQAVREQEGQIKSLSGSASDLISKYDELGSAIKNIKSSGGMGGITKGLEAERQGLLGQYAGTMAEKSKALQTLGTLNAQMAGGGGGIAGGGEALGLGGMLKAGAKGALALYGVGMFGLNESMAGSTGLAQMQANRVNLLRPGYQEAMSGDFKRALALQNLSRAEREEYNKQFGTTATVQVYGKNIASGAIGAVMGAAGLGGGGGGMPGGIGGAISSAKNQNDLITNVVKHTNALMEGMAPRTSMAADKFRNELMTRVGVSRILGTGLTERKGDVYGRLEASLMREGGFNPQELAAANVGFRGLAGRRAAGSYAEEIMRANSIGLSGYDQMMGAALRAGSGGAFARRAIGGNIDQYAGVQLGQAIIGNGFDVMGVTGGMGALSAAQRGMGFNGTAADFNRVQQVQAGMQLGDQLATGTLDPYTRATNLTSALNRRPGAGFYAADYYANGANFRQILDMAYANNDPTKMTTLARGYGLTSEDYKNKLKDITSNFFQSRWVDTQGNTDIEEALRGWRASGMDPLSYTSSIKDPKKRLTVQQNLGGWFGQVSGMGQEAGLGAFGLGVGSLSSEDIRNGRINAGVGGAEGLGLEALSKNLRNLSDEMTGMGTEFAKAIAATPLLAEAMNEGAKSLSTDAETIAIGMHDIAGGVEALSDALRKAGFIKTVKESNRPELPPKTQNPGTGSGGLGGGWTVVGE